MRRFSGAISGLALLALVACSSGSDVSDRALPSEVRIGLLVEEMSQTGQDAIHGAQLAADLINETLDLSLPLAAERGLPNLNGADVAIVTVDVTGDPGTAAGQVAMLASRHHPAGMVMVGSSELTAAASLRSDRLGLPFLDAYSGENYLTTRGLDWFFRLAPTDRMLGEELFSLLRSQELAGVPTRRLVLVYADDSLSQTTAATIEDLAAEGGFSVVDELPIDTDNSDEESGDDDAEFDTLSDQIEDVNADVVIAVSHDQRVANAIVRSLNPAESSLPIIALGRGFTVQDPISDADRLLCVRAWSTEFASRHPAAREVTEQYTALFNSRMTEAAAGAFTAVLTLAAAIDRAGSTEPEEIRSALQSIQFSGTQTIMPWEGIRFASSGQNTDAAGVVEQVIGGRLSMVYPTEISHTHVVWPATDGGDS